MSKHSFGGTGKQGSIMSGLNLKLILEAVDRITAPVRAIKAKLVETFKSATAGARALAEQMDKAGKKAAEVGGFMTSRFSLPILGIGALSIRSAGQVEELTMQMEHLAGGAEKAREFVGSLQGYIDKFGTEELSKSVQLMETAGYSMDEIKKRIATLGDVAAGSRTPLSALTEQYIDLRKAGKVSDGDLTAMMKANIPIVAELAKQLGKTDKQIINMAANGKISFEQYRKAMQGLTEEGGRFNGAIERQGKSIFGVFREMGFALRNSLADLGFDLWKDLNIADRITSITSAVRGLIEGFMSLPKWLKSSITWFVLILAVIGPVLMIVGQLTVGVAGLLFAFGKLPLMLMAVTQGLRTLMLINTVGAAIGNFITALRAGYTVMEAFNLVLAANPIVMIVIAITALAAAGYMLWKRWDKVKAFFSRLWSVVRSHFMGGIKIALAVLAPFLSVPTILVKHWGAISGFFGSLWGGIKEIFKDAIDGVLEYLQPLIDAVNIVVGGLAQIGKNVAGRIGGVWRHVSGDAQAASADSGAHNIITPATPHSARTSRVDAGGTINIAIDQNNRARVTEARSNDRRVKYQTPDTGALMGGI
ncbi:MAG: tape measure protein [Alphaproteobacteria bacterium]|nr:tape measure protein [Alphaproteobacteria bacterium]